VIVKKLALVVEGRDDMELDLTGDLTQLKKQVNYYIHLATLLFPLIYHNLTAFCDQRRCSVQGAH